jgi:integrase
MKKVKARQRYGGGSLFQRGDGYWVAALELGYDSQGRRRRWQGVSKTYKGALDKLEDAVHSIRDTGVAPSRSMTTEAWLHQWLEEIVEPTKRPKTTQSYRSAVKAWIIPALGKVPVSKVNLAQVRALHAKVQSATSVGNANSVLRVLKVALSDAEREDIVPRNVAKLFELKGSKVTRKALTVDAARSFLAATADHPLFSRWLVALVMGVRRGETLGLEWDRVDFAAGTIDVSWQLAELRWKHGCPGGDKAPTCGKKRVCFCPDREYRVPNGYEFRVLEGSKVLGPPKTGAGLRVLPMPPVVAQALREHRKASMLKPNPFNLVWHDDDGMPLGNEDLSIWKAELAKHGLPEIDIHSARHTTATLLMELGVDVSIVQAIVGHSNPATTKAYQHADLTMARRALEQLGEALA